MDVEALRALAFRRHVIQAWDNLCSATALADPDVSPQLEKVQGQFEEMMRVIPIPLSRVDN